MKHCLRCNFINQSEAPTCARCGTNFVGPVNSGVFENTRSPRTGMIVAGIVAVVLGASWLKGEWQLAGAARTLQAQFETRNAEYAREKADQEESIRNRLAEAEVAVQRKINDPDYVSGQVGTRARNAEWERRVAHDPRFASSPLETNLLRMARLGADPEVSARDALAEVGRLSAPKGSRVEVTSSGDLFVVKVAFKMSALAAHETGAVTKHHSTGTMRREVEEISAQVLRDLFDSCGTRGIGKLQVSCNHALRQTLIPSNITEGERRELWSRAPLVMDKLYRMSMDGAAARSVADWRRISVSDLIRRMTVEYDGFEKLTINGATLPGFPAADPDTPLKF